MQFASRLQIPFADSLLLHLVAFAMECVASTCQRWDEQEPGLERETCDFCRAYKFFNSFFASTYFSQNSSLELSVRILEWDVLRLIFHSFFPSCIFCLVIPK